jgi:hypothetical protein
MKPYIDQSTGTFEWKTFSAFFFSHAFFLLRVAIQVLPKVLAA